MNCLAVNSAYVAADKLSAADKSFMTRAAQVNLFEIRLGELARKKTTNDAVRKLAARLIADHSANNAELSKLASKYDLKLPTEWTKASTSRWSAWKSSAAPYSITPM